MADSEKSFPDRAQRAHELHAACDGLAPAYTAPPNGTTLAAFDAKIILCEGRNNAVSAADTAWSEVVTQRVAVIKTIKFASTQLLNYIKSGAGWKSKFPAAKRLADAVRGNKPPRKPPPPAPPGSPAPKKRDRGGQSYAEMETNFRGLVSLATALPGFAPTDVKIQTGTLNGLLSSLKGCNESLPDLEAAFSEAQVQRHREFYTPETGLADMYQSVKTTVKGQYGTASSQWAQVKGIKW